MTGKLTLQQCYLSKPEDFKTILRPDLFRNCFISICSYICMNICIYVYINIYICAHTFVPSTYGVTFRCSIS